jgi:hypothetical protein
MKQYFLVPILALLLFSCKKEPQPVTNTPVSKLFYHIGFDKIEAGNDVDIIVSKSSTFSIKATGNAVDVNRLIVSVANGKLKIGYVNNAVNRGRLSIEVKMPSLTGFEIYRKAILNISGFTETVAVEGKVSESSKAIVAMSAPVFNFEAANRSEINVTGSSEEVHITATDFSKANTYLVSAKLAKIVATNNAEVKVFASDELFASANINSYIFYKGSPGNKFLSELDTSTIHAD